MINKELVDAFRNEDITVAGSLLAVTSPHRLHLSRVLESSQIWSHADVIEGSYLGQPGVSYEHIKNIAKNCRNLDVHLMVDDLETAIDRLPTGIKRITIQQREALNADLDLCLSAARCKAQQVWVAVDHPSDLALAQLQRFSIDGILGMLTPPGQPGHTAELQRLGNVPHQKVPWGVDGGVNTGLLRPLKQKGAEYAVIGRALTEAANLKANEFDLANGKQP